MANGILIATLRPREHIYITITEGRGCVAEAKGKKKEAKAKKAVDLGGRIYSSKL